MKVSRWSLLVGIGAVLVGCSNGVGPGDLFDLERAMDDWEDAAIQSYSYEVATACFCPPITTQPHRVSVIDGVVISAEAVADGTPVDPAFLSSFRTVEQLFQQIQDVIDLEPDFFEATYDSDLGYPTSINVDIEMNAADEEFFTTITNFSIIIVASLTSR